MLAVGGLSPAAWSLVVYRAYTHLGLKSWTRAKHFTRKVVDYAASVCQACNSSKLLGASAIIIELN